jgi:hypothetical protein
MAMPHNGRHLAGAVLCNLRSDIMTTSTYRHEHRRALAIVPLLIAEQCDQIGFLQGDADQCRRS